MAVQVAVIAEWLGAEPKSDFDLAQIVRRGLPLNTQAVLLSHGLTKDEFHYIVIPLRTFRHRRERLISVGENSFGKRKYPGRS